MHCCIIKRFMSQCPHSALSLCCCVVLVANINLVVAHPVVDAACDWRLLIRTTSSSPVPVAPPWGDGCDHLRSRLLDFLFLSLPRHVSAGVRARRLFLIVGDVTSPQTRCWEFRTRPVVDNARACILYFVLKKGRMTRIHE